MSKNLHFTKKTPATSLYSIMHEIFIPLRRAGLDLLSTFVLTLVCVYRDGSTPEKSTRSRRVINVELRC
jgi:hypothetical protein